MADFLPRRESELVGWIGSFKEQLAATAGHYGISAPSLQAYTELADAYLDAYALSAAPSTRTASVLEKKDALRRACIEMTRAFNGIIQANPQTTNAMRSNLGLKLIFPRVRKIDKPTTAPIIHIPATIDRQFRVRLTDPSQPTRKGLPTGVWSAEIMYFVGDTIPGPGENWVSLNVTTRAISTQTLRGHLEFGQRIWFTAMWSSPRAERGPAAYPVMSRFAGATMQMEGLARAA